ncbi:MAG: Lon protease family protein [bacterium]
MSGKHPEVPVEKLRRICDPDEFDFETTEEVEGVKGIIGQSRAVEAIKFGLGIKSQGYNIYVAGMPGTGKTFTVKSFLEEIARREPTASDWCYVYNFHNPYKPKALRLPPGKGTELERDMRELVDTLRDEIPRAFESEDYDKQSDAIIREFRTRRDKLISSLEEKARESGFVLQNTQIGLMTIPVVGGKPIGEEEYEALDEEAKREIMRRKDSLQEEIEDAMREASLIEREARRRVRELDRDVARFAVGYAIDEIENKYKNFPKVVEYLEAVREDIVQHVEDFKSPSGAQQPPPASPQIPQETPFTKYKINVLVSNAGMEHAPVVIESNPTYANLFGKIERRAQLGALVTDFTMIKPGSLHRANGGYLVLNIQDILKNPLSWDGLKRTIKDKEIKIEDVAEQYTSITTEGLKPEPIPLDVKIIIIGDPHTYHLFYNFDDDFREMFKVRADFDVWMDRSPANLREYASFISERCREENLKHFHKSGVAKVIEYSSRMVEDQEKLSTKFGEIADLLREASFWASESNSRYVMAEHVEKAIEKKIYRSNLVEENIRDMIARRNIFIDTEGEVVGQVNGLAVYDVGDFSFGKPSRITANIYMGRDGVIDIERESKLGGNIHTKGVMILSGYLGWKYAQDKPLSLSARICFEQSYEGVDGDSASSTELYALISSLSGLPIKQSIAVTGSVNQKGELQPIGGVNEKIEGFFEICKLRGLTGDQGVIIPKANVKNLMLKPEVIEAVRGGKFHIYPVETIDEGIEILTGVPAGRRLEDGSFEEGSVSARVDSYLRKLAEEMRGYPEDDDGSRPADESGGEDEEADEV